MRSPTGSALLLELLHDWLLPCAFKMSRCDVFTRDRDDSTLFKYKSDHSHKGTTDSRRGGEETQNILVKQDSNNNLTRNTKCKVCGPVRRRSNFPSISASVLMLRDTLVLRDVSKSINFMPLMSLSPSQQQKVRQQKGSTRAKQLTVITHRCNVSPLFCPTVFGWT